MVKSCSVGSNSSSSSSSNLRLVKDIGGKVRYFIFLLVCFLSINVSSLFSQLDKETGFKTLFEDDIKSQITSNSLTQMNSSPVGNDVNPDYYYPGPGDLLLLKIFPVNNNENYIEITPDNLLVLPRSFGEIITKDKTLNQIKQEIEEKIKLSIKDVRVVLSIKKPRSCMISISGNVVLPGTYIFPATYTISTVLTLVNRNLVDEKTSPVVQTLSMESSKRKNETEVAFLSSGVSPSTSYSTRNIVVISNNGKSLNVDLEKSYALQDNHFDPYIREGDKIYVPNEEVNIPIISISGEVLRPASLQYKKGDKLSFLLKCGAGLKPTADKSRIFFYSSTGEQKNISVDDNLNLLSEDFDLSSGCFVVVEKEEESLISTNALVSVTGKVNKEGIYPIISGQTTLKEVIEKAGGVKQNALLSDAYILRRTQKQNTFFDNKRELLDFFQNSDLTLEDTTRLMIDLYNKKPYVACDFQTALNPKTKNDEVLLENGDVINIPEKTHKVYIFGKVNNPGFVEFSEGKDLLWYINKAGGYSPIAQESRTRIIRGTGKIWLNPEDFAITDGDNIYVPSKPDVPKQVSDQQYAMIASVIGALASLTLFLVNTFKY